MRAGVRPALAAMALLLALAGCKTAPPQKRVLGPGADAPWPEQLAALEKLDSYALTGRVAVAAAGEGFSGTLRFRQQAERSELALDGPMGIGGARVVLQESELSVTNSRGETLDGPAARVELERRLGFELPLHQLRWWLLGIPEPQVGATSETAETPPDALPVFEQDGWRVNVQTRAPAMGFSLPQRLTIEREGARLKLLVDQWNP